MEKRGGREGEGGVGLSRSLLCFCGWAAGDSDWAGRAVASSTTHPAG